MRKLTKVYFAILLSSCLNIRTVHTAEKSLGKIYKNDSKFTCVKALSDERAWDDFLVAAVRGHFVSDNDILNIKRRLNHYNGNTEYKQQLLMYAVSNGNTTVVKILREDPDITDMNVQDKHGFTAFHIAVTKGFSRTVRAMIKWPEVDINKTDHKGMTPLMTAINTNPFLARDIIDNSNIKINIQDKQFKATALHYAVIVDSEVLVKLLLAVPGIDTNMKDVNGEDVFQLAEHLNRERIKEILDDYRTNKFQMTTYKVKKFVDDALKKLRQNR